MLLDELLDIAKRSEVTLCLVGTWLASQDTEIQQVIQGLVGNQNVNQSELLALLKKHQPDLPFKRTSFVAHMRGICTCQTV